MYDLTTPVQDPTVGRRTGVVAGLRSIVAPWVELQAVDASEPFHDDFRVVGRPRESRQRNDVSGPGDPFAWGVYLVDQLEVYRNHLMLFRWAGNAILSALSVHETRPVQEYHSGQSLSGRVPAVRAIADSLTGWFRVAPDENALRFRSPLEVLAAAVWDDRPSARMVCVDELAMLFAVITQAVGIPSWFVIDRMAGNRLTVECELGHSFTDRAAGVASFDPRTGRLVLLQSKPTGRGRLEFAPGGEGDTKSWASGPSPAMRAPAGRLPADLNGVLGTGHTAQTRWWARPRHAPSWYAELADWRKRFRTGWHGSLFRRPVHWMARTVVGENFGPETTGALIATGVRTYVQKMRPLFRTIVISELRDRGIDWRQLNQLQLADAIAKLVRDYFAYREEMVRVEEIVGPLMQWELHAFAPGVQRHDCDDLGFNTMTLWESMDIASAIRLAGDAGGRSRYHVYPLAVIDGQAWVFDVSAPDLYREMNHGTNYEDFLPRNPEKLEKALVRVDREKVRMVAGWDCLRVVGNEVT